MKSINPTTEELLCEYEPLSLADVELQLQLASEASREWARTTIEERSRLLLAAADRLRARAADDAELMTSEMGKPIAASEAEIEKCAWVCEYYAENGPGFLAAREVPTDARRSVVRFDPLGPVLAIMPWNFPYWQVFRFAAPALLAGNVALLKHAGNVSGTALAIEEIFREAGFPPHVFKTLLIPSDRISDVIAHPAVRAVTLTGSERAGEAVAEQAGRLLKKTVLELGGSDPFIVLADANIEQAAEQAAVARTINTGQSCIAAKRFIVEAAVHDEFLHAFTTAMQKLTVGDPMDRSNQLGPLARADLVETLHEQVQSSLLAGARLCTGGGRLVRTGFFYAPTILADVEPGMVAFDEEIFGPVAAVTQVADAERAIELANHSSFGLGASLWTSDLQRAEQFAGQLEAGAVFVNQIVKSDPRLPFGGVKRSGYGRELAEFGIHEFVNIKTVWIDAAADE